MSENIKLKAKSFKARFLEAGVIKYGDEMVLIKPENLMAIADNFKGCHVIIDHQVIDDNNTSEIIGYITNVWFNEQDGWAWCDFTINNEEAITLIDKGYSVSCAYVPVYKQGGVYHNIPYDQEIIGGEAIHLAIVKTPRYEDAIILKNSIDKEIMTIFKFNKKKDSEVKEMELQNSILELEDGKQISMKDAISIIENAIKNEEEEEKEAKKNKKTKANESDEYEVGGKMMKVSEMKEKLEAMGKNKNEKDEEKENEGDEEDKKENEDEDEEKDKKEAKKNSLDKSEISKKRALYNNGSEKEYVSSFVSDNQKFATGKAVYGSPQNISK